MAIVIQFRPMKRCRRCGNDYDEEAFFSIQSANHVVKHTSQPRRRAICVGCELTERNDPTPLARATRKARGSIYNHAKKYSLDPKEFGRRFGWENDRIAHDILHAAEISCGYCWTPYAEMGHGLDDITIDIRDPTKEPYYHTNVQICCRTCNSEKSTMSPELWARRLIAWRRWREWAQAIADNPVHGLPLFQSPLLV